LSPYDPTVGKIKIIKEQNIKEKKRKEQKKNRRVEIIFF
jgi:hypothetical protein